MRTLITFVFLFAISIVSAQTVPIEPPIEERYQPSYWWWVIGVLIAMAAGIGAYMLIKKDPRKDAVR